jgi:hypothetical protein
MRVIGKNQVEDSMKAMKESWEKGSMKVERNMKIVASNKKRGKE